MANSATIGNGEQEFTIPAADPGDVPPEAFTKDGGTVDEWALMSSADRAAFIETKDYAPEEGEIPEAVLEEVAGAKETPTVEGEKPAEGGDKPPIEAAPAKPDEKPPVEAAKPADDKPADAVVSDEDLLAFRPVISAKELDVKVEILADMQVEHKKKVDELYEKQEQGEITSRERDEQIRELDRQLMNFEMTERDRLKDQQRDNLTWVKEQRAFFSARKEYGDIQADGRIKLTSPKAAALYGALGQMITEIEGSQPGVHGMQLLIKADRAVREAFGLAPIGKGAAPAKPTDPVRDKPAAVKPADTDLTTLGDVPEAGRNETGSGWGAVDRMPDKQREAWLAKQSDEVREAYLNDLTRYPEGRV